MADLTVVILTYNEALHIERCIASVRDVATRIVVVDSLSTDATCDLARAAGAEVFMNPWTNYATQFNWALDNTGISTGWVFRLDADEVVLPELAAVLPTTLATTEAAGLTVNRRIHFLGRRLRWGGTYPLRMLRIWRAGHGRCEDRWMDEHVLVDGSVGHVPADIADINLNNIGWWIEKHNRYATREAVDALLAKTKPPAGLSTQARVKRWVKVNAYSRLPVGLRALLYFVYRYFILLGCLDGWPGLVFFALQSGWYRFLVDVKIDELRRLMATRGESLAKVVGDEYGLRL